MGRDGDGDEGRVGDDGRVILEEKEVVRVKSLDEDAVAASSS